MLPSTRHVQLLKALSREICKPEVTEMFEKEEMSELMAGIVMLESYRDEELLKVCQPWGVAHSVAVQWIADCLATLMLCMGKVVAKQIRVGNREPRVRMMGVTTARK